MSDSVGVHGRETSWRQTQVDLDHTPQMIIIQIEPVNTTIGEPRIRIRSTRRPQGMLSEH